MKKYTMLIAAALLSAALCSCTSDVPEETSVVSEAEPYPTEAVEDYILTRGYPLTDLFSDVTADGARLTFPVKADDFAEGGVLSAAKFSDNTIFFENGGTVYAELCFDNGKTVNSHGVLQAEKDIAPADFTVYGVKFGMHYAEATGIAGIPNQVNGEPDKESGFCVYYGAESQRFEMYFEDDRLIKMTLMQ